MTPTPVGIAARIQGQIDRIEARIKHWAEAGIYTDESWQRADRKRLEELNRRLEHELSSKRVVVLGTIHEYQLDGRPMNSELGVRLQFLIESFAATTIMEEWTENEPASFAALKFGSSLEYSNVGTPSDEDFGTFVCAPVNHPAHDGILGGSDNAPSMNEYGPLEKQENREIRMLESIQRQMENHHVGIFVVGLAHLHSMAIKLNDAKFNVTAYGWLG
jgi:hypothetical protein